MRLKVGRVNLSGIHKLLNEFHHANVRYCHFKSNLHVAAGIAGETDLDILVDRSAHAEVVACLVSCGFKKFTAKLATSYPAVDDWLGFDHTSGALVHLHLHWQMVAGEPNLKGYRIPWETEILSQRQFDEENQIYIASPEIELLLIIVRASLKFRVRNALQTFFGKHYPAPNSDIEREYLWLKERADREILSANAQRLLSPEIATLINELLDKEALDPVIFQGIRDLVTRLFMPYRTYGMLSGNMYRWFREFYAKSAQLLNRKFGTLIVRRRTPATGGLIVALLGVDGSGKSTQVKQLLKWLSWKLDVGYVYFGSGDGPVSLLRRPLTFFARRRESSKAMDHAVSGQDLASRRRSMMRNLLHRIFRAIWAIVLVMEKRSRLVKAIRARNKGMIVVCDRYPQNQFAGFNDGPLLTDWLESSWPWAAMARFEQKTFELFDAISPDVVFKLHVSKAVAASRKADTPDQMIEKKIDVVRSLKFGQGCMVVDIDAERPLESVSLELRTAIWNVL